MDELTIIVPTLNEHAYILKLLDSIIQQEYASKLQVIVVDGQSSDNTKELVEQYRTKLKDLQCISTTANIGHQRNVGVAQAKYRYLLFLDADVMLPHNCLNTLSTVIQGQDNFIAAVLHTSQRLTPLDIVTLGVIYALFFLSWLARTPVTNGDCILTTRAVHDSIKGFKEGAILGEDTDYGIRAVREGAKYKFIRSTHIIASDRRIKESGKFGLLLVWSKAFLRARKHGPTYSDVEYPFGHYAKRD